MRQIKVLTGHELELPVAGDAGDSEAVKHLGFMAGVERRAAAPLGALDD